MDSFSIDQFWKARFAGVQRMEIASLPGWESGPASEAAYIPARMSLRADFKDLDQKVWLIAAPGAVGKSALAKQLCAATGAIYLNLAAAATVAGNYLVGGLFYAQLQQAWTDGATAIVIDALDEARLRVTQSGFEAFLSDVAKVAQLGKFPIIVLGRVGIIEEAWTILCENSRLNPPIFDIELFSREEAEKFVLAQLKKMASQESATGGYGYPNLAGSLSSHMGVYEKVIGRVIAGIGSLSEQDGNRFVGYAPVLHAVAKVIAAEDNPARIDAQVERVLSGRVLLNLTNEILDRETGKLVTQVGQVAGPIEANLYDKDEQLERLACRLFSLPSPPPPAAFLAPNQLKAYEEAVQNLLPQHPFLDGAGTGPSSAVFGARIVAAALNSRRADLVRGAERYASHAQHTPNPFLYDFYREAASSSDLILAEHIGLVFDSVLARAKPDDAVRLSVDEDEENSSFNVEIMILRQDESSTQLEFNASNSGIIRLGRRIAGVSIDAINSAVELGEGDQLELISPVSIVAGRLSLNCNQLVVKVEPHSSGDKVVSMECQELAAEPSLQAPTVRGDAILRVTWPGAANYPWNYVFVEETEDEDPETADALRALRRFAMAFRSHSKGALARFRGKIEHARMLKSATGLAVFEKLKEDKIIFLSGEMYYLDPKLLGEKVGVSFMSINLKQYSPAARKYVQGLR